ncbi:MULTISPECIES: GH92 family glycosyl hydrolase [Streptomyces]|uniref:GH92 family glycosyl hydrolase n=1 Tax=Streptomyces TaxID=1883 RepID=UPI00163BAD78|nr:MULTISPECIES: GH92 family glycosyl hydrolase [Streptomyces]MBC2876665.1 glycoside hydrolase family 92 protein [Streptomyces sp. TYQ1024]UBI36295.1 GH92 family glycosyl hydrolase [Streptomyces mobaraensis]UKW28889.1 GH92 family glycosyl hydrolase [Streptomyces sp. TYQ1024]
MRQRLRRRRRALARPAAVLVAAILVTAPQIAPSGAAAAPAGRAADTAAGGRAEESFASSFEPGDPRPDWRNTAETGPDGRARSSGIDGGDGQGIPGNATDKVTAVRASGENAEGGEIKENLVDGEPTSKWLVRQRTAWLEFDLSEPVAVTRYALTSANDAPGRDPRDWTLRGSADGKSWTVLDTRRGENFEKRLQTRQFTLATGGAYRHFRLDITGNAGDELTQLAEVQFATADPGTPPPAAMRTYPDTGPAASPTAKPRAGFTGKHALRYGGTHRAKGRAYAYNKVFAVNVRVTARTRLAYKIFPAMAERDPRYPATHVSLDLAFTDGTYLSQLDARDQHGAPLTPRGQADSKTLYVNQWNSKEAAIGRVAAGKTVARVLVAYDAPDGPAPFRGWIDDVSLAPAPEEKTPAHPADRALTTRGTLSSSSFSRGNTFPATAVPHGFTFWTPVTDAGSTSWLYRYAAANNADNLPILQAFSASHEPSPWMGDRQTFQVMPSVAAGTPDASRTARALPFHHSRETATPHHYGVTFDNGLKADIVPTDHAAMMRFTFPSESADKANVILDNVTNAGGLTLDTAHGTFTGWSDVKSGLSTGAGRLYVYGAFDAPVTGGGKLRRGGAGDASDVTGYLRFRPGADRTVTLRIATSLIGTDQAKANLEQEIPAGTPYARVHDRARDAWDRLLGRVEVEGATADQLTTLYSGLYRLFLYPNSGFENTGSADHPKQRYASPFSPPTGASTPTRTGARIVDGEVYVNNGFWDTYRTTWPAYSLLAPGQAGRMVDGFVRQFKDGGWVSRWSSPGYADLMTGTSSDIAFADAHAKGVRFDAEAAYEAALRNATVAPTDPGTGRKGMDTSVFLGWTSTKTHEGMSWALDGYLNDFGLARMGQALYAKTHRERYREESEYFLNRARGYVKLFDRRIGFFQGRNEDGSWRLSPEAYDPRVWGYDYTETNGWNFAFTAPQDTRGLAALYGGRSGLAKKLDAYFATPETGAPEFAGSYGGVIHEMTEARDVRMGMYGHSNQPSHHIAYLYDAAGQPWKTQAKVREVLSRLYLGSEIGQGYPGDEDNGEMSAWYVFGALGFYPLVMGQGEYAIGSPLFTKATVHLENGRDLVVKAPRNSARNVYVQGLTVDGKPWNSTALPHSVVAKGATLEFAMGPEPSSWASGEGAGPTSISQDDKVPDPLSDVTVPDGSALTDNTSRTAATVTTVPLEVTAGSRVTSYTLTSADRARAPKSWVLEGSENGRDWSATDRREGQSFTWDRQTRVFSLHAPVTYRHYRLKVVGGEASLAEMELLGSPQR